MELTTNKCIGCIYYTKINTYTTSPSTTRDELVEKYGAYYTCSKPYLVKCPRESGCIAEKSSIPIKTRRCIICDNNCMDSVCDECKNAMKRLKELLNSTTTTSASTSDDPLTIEATTPDEFIIYNEENNYGR